MKRPYDNSLVGAEMDAPMRIGYVGFMVYNATFEINEVAELLCQKPDSRIYTFHRRLESGVQTERVREIPTEIVTWSFRSIVSSFFYFFFRRPFALAGSAVSLLVQSYSNPLFWLKNTLVFLRALPILADADKHSVTHLHANFGSAPGTIAWLGKKILGTGMSMTHHAFDIYSTALDQRDPLKKRKLRDADFVVAVHRHGLEHLMQLVPDAPKEKFKVIRICVSLNSQPRQPLDPPMLLAIGRLVPKKGFDVLLKAAAILKRRGTAVQVRILGEGPALEELTSLIQAEDISDIVELAGHIPHSELGQHLAQAKALVMPSIITPEGDRDGIPTVVVEAWISHTPVVASLVGGMAEVLKHDVTGLVFQSGDSEELASNIDRLLGSDQLRKTLIEGGLSVAQSEFNPTINVRELINCVASGGDGFKKPRD